MLLDDLLGRDGRADFLARHYLRSPFAAPGGAGRWAEACSWTALDRLCAEPSSDLVLSSAGRPVRDAVAREPGAARRWLARGWSVALRRAERHDTTLAALAAALAASVHGPVDIQVHATPAGAHGFGWHCDPEEVVIIQCAGAKEWRLRENTVAPAPLPEAMPSGAAFAREEGPVLQCRLEPGDWLYIPGGWWHMGIAGESDSLSIAAGALAATPLALLDHLRPTLPHDARWRRRLPATGGPDGPDQATLAEWGAALADAAEDLARRLRDPALIHGWVAAQRRAAARLILGPAVVETR